MNRNREQHTRGEWRLYGTRAVEAQAFDGSWKLICAQVRGGSGVESDANARLICSAPNLLEALTDLLVVIQTDDLIPESVSYMLAARQAVEKATASA